MHLAANPNTSTHPIEDFIAALSDIHIEDRIQRGAPGGRGSDPGPRAISPLRHGP